MSKAVRRQKIREMSFGSFEKFLKYKGYFFNRSRGSSHHIYKNSLTNRKVSIVSKHGRTVHPKSIIIALHELESSTTEFGEWMEVNM